jgi:hypothetical protein
MSPIARKPGRKSSAPPTKNDSSPQKTKATPEMRKTAEQNIARVKALEVLYRPLHEAARAELQKTASGCAALEEMNAVGREIDELSKGISAKKGNRAEVGVQVRERVKKFLAQHGDQLHAAYAKHGILQPSAMAVAQTLRPETAGKTSWVAETSVLGSMLMTPKQLPQDVGTVSQGLGGDMPPAVQACVTAPYELGGFDFETLNNATVSWNINPTYSSSQPVQGYAGVAGEADVNALFGGVGTCFGSAFVGHDFDVPPGPTSYTATITYDWQGDGGGFVIFGIGVVSVDLAILIDLRDGTKITEAREVSLLTIPVASGDSFEHFATNVSVTIPFTRDGSNGTVRIMAGADAQATVSAVSGSANYWTEATIRQICIMSVG